MRGKHSAHDLAVRVLREYKLNVARVENPDLIYRLVFEAIRDGIMENKHPDYNDAERQLEADQADKVNDLAEARRHR